MKNRSTSNGVAIRSILLCTVCFLCFNFSLNTPQILPPGLICPDNTNQATAAKGLQSLSGELTATDPTINFSDYSCFELFFPTEEGEHEYDAVEFIPSVDGWYTFFLGASFVGNMSLYQGVFNIDNPCIQLMAATEAGYNLPLPPSLSLPEQRLTFFLRANEPYSIMVSNQALGTLGDWEVNAYHETAGTLSGFSFPSPYELSFDLLCMDSTTVLFASPQQWIVNADGSLDTTATRTAFFGGSQALLDSFLQRLNYTGMPLVTDDCGPLIVTLTDELDLNGDCGNIVITRTFSVQADEENCDGETTNCQQIITLRHPDFTDLQLPPYSVSIPCNVEYPGDGDIGGSANNPSTEIAGAPVLHTVTGYLEIDSLQCNLQATYMDEPRINICGAVFKYRRNWSIINWCTPMDQLDYDQYIRVDDLIGPEVENNVDTISVPTSPFSCAANFVVPDLVVVDGNGCSASESTIYAITEGGTPFASGEIANNDIIQLPADDYLLTRCAEDDCGNETCVETVIIVVDQIEPVAVCIPDPEILIGGGDIANGVEGVARVYGEDVNAGSFDNCGEVFFEVRRNFWRNGTCHPDSSRWSPWGDFVDFYCCDLMNDEIILELRVTDEAGEQNICITHPTVLDILAPFCYAPEDHSYTCLNGPDELPGDIETAYSTNFEATSILMSTLFGNASGTDNCAVDTIVELQPVFQLNDCGWGQFTRRFQAWQALPNADLSDGLQVEEVTVSTNPCMQVITIVEAHSFIIDFPEDAVTDCGMVDIPGVELTETGCDVIAVSVSDPVSLPVTGDECYQLAITYDVINWCVWDGEYDGYEIPRMSEDDGEVLANGFTVEAAERPVVRVVSGIGPDDENCDGILSESENESDDANDILYFMFIDRNHPDVDGDSALEDVAFDNMAETPDGCLPADAEGNRNYGRLRYTQVVRVNNAASSTAIVVPEFGGATAECPQLEPGQFGTTNGGCTAAVSLPFSVSANCSDLGDLNMILIDTFIVELDSFVVDTDGDGQISATEFTVDGDITDAITSDSDGNYVFNADLPVIHSSLGDSTFHAIRITTIDNCGEEATELIGFSVVDCYVLAPICINGMTVTLEPQDDGLCSSTIVADDFVFAPSYDCNGQGPAMHPQTGLPVITQHAIYLAEEVESDPDFVPDSTHTTVTLTEEDDETVVVYVYAFDEEGNYNYCETYVLVQTSIACYPVIAGMIRTKEDDAVEGVEVSSGTGDLSITDATGYYSFTTFFQGGSYTIAPFLNEDTGNGINTIDMIILIKHINGIELMTNPYQLIAADVDASGDITMEDFEYIRQLLLGNINTFPNNTSWRFVVADYVFPVPTNPWFEQFPSIINLSNVFEDVLDADFVGVKVGDLNGTAESNFQQVAESRNKETFHLTTEDIILEAGNTYTVPITAGDLDKIAGLQGTFHLKNLKLLDINYNLVQPEDVGQRYLEEGHLTLSWFQPREAMPVGRTELPADQILFSMVLRSEQDQSLSDALSINSRYTAAEAYGQLPLVNERTRELMELAISFHTRTDIAAQRIELHQNTPNPFQETTLIGFYLPEFSDIDELTSVSINISDASGRVLKVIKEDCTAGYHTVKISKQDLQGATGVLTYTLVAGDYQISKQMMIVK